MAFRILGRIAYSAIGCKIVVITLMGNIIMRQVLHGNVCDITEQCSLKYGTMFFVRNVFGNLERFPPKPGRCEILKQLTTLLRHAC